MTKPNVELVADHPYLGSGASLLKPWRGALIVLFVCSFGVTLAHLVALEMNPQVFSHPSSHMRRHGFALPFLLRLSHLTMVVLLVGFWIRRSPQRLERVVSRFCDLPIWRAHFAKDDLEARVRRRATNIRFAVPVSALLFVFAFFWLFNCAFLFM